MGHIVELKQKIQKGKGEPIHSTGFSLKTAPRIILGSQIAAVLASIVAANTFAILELWFASAGFFVAACAFGLVVAYHIRVISTERRLILDMDRLAQKCGYERINDEGVYGGKFMSPDDKDLPKDVKKAMPKIMKAIKKKIEESKKNGEEIRDGFIEIDGEKFYYKANELKDDDNTIKGELTGSLTDFGKISGGDFGEGDFGEGDSNEVEDDEKLTREDVDKAAKDFFKNLKKRKEDNGEN